MHRLSSSAAWWLGGLLVCAIVNIALVVIVVGGDILFQAVPQFAAPVVIAALAVGAVLAALFALFKRLMRPTGNPDSGDEGNSTAGGFYFRRSPVLRSAVVIRHRRRNETAGSTAQNTNIYETTI